MERIRIHPHPPKLPPGGAPEHRSRCPESLANQSSERAESVRYRAQPASLDFLLLLTSTITKRTRRSSIFFDAIIARPLPVLRTHSIYLSYRSPSSCSISLGLLGYIARLRDGVEVDRKGQSGRLLWGWANKPLPLLLLYRCISTFLRFAWHVCVWGSLVLGFVLVGDVSSRTFL